MSADSVTCYACDQPATTKEHAPPSSFFPKGERNNLITVPSCREHNNDQSKDVEYARNVITIMFGVNEVGQQHFSDKSLRSLEHSPALLCTTFSGIRRVNFQGVATGAFTVNRERVTSTMKACIRALHFRETQEKIFNWEVILPNLYFSGSTTDREIVEWNQLISVFHRLPFMARPTNSPDVFEYAVAEMQEGKVYSLRFYRAFCVFAFPSKWVGLS